MRKVLLMTTTLLVTVVLSSFGKQGYDVQVKAPGVKDSMAYLAYYYGKALPNLYKRDSARFDKNGVAHFHSDDSAFVGGIYIILLSDKKTYFEFLLNSGDELTITANLNKLPEGLKFKNSPENERFVEYMTFLRGYSTGQETLKKELAQAKNSADTAAVRKKASATSKDLTNYRRHYVEQYPNTLLSAIFSALEAPQVPGGDHFLADGKTKDSTFAYKYYKTHFWDGFDFQDERLIHTPIFDAKLEEYMTKWIVQWPDTVEHESDMLLKKARGTKDIFKYTLWWLTRNVESSKVMGMDEAFVYIVENYYMKGDAFWLTNDELTKYTDRAMKIAPNVLGNLAPEVKLINVFDGKEESMLEMKSPYTLLIFYSPDCSHCQKELPEIDSLYEAVLKKQGVKVYTVATEGDDKKIAEFLTKNKLEKWTNTWDPEHTGDWRGKYDVFSTPTIYLMDEKKIIRGKKLDHTNIEPVIEIQGKLKSKK